MLLNKKEYINAFHECNNCARLLAYRLVYEYEDPVA